MPPSVSNFSPELFLSTLALIGAVIVTSALLSGLVEKTGLPQVAVFLGLGAAIGPAGLNLLDVDVHSSILRVVGTLSLVLVLFTDALSLNLADVRKNRLLSALVLGPGTLVSALLIAGFGWLILRLPPAAALILGAALASTDPVMLRALLKRPGLDRSVSLALRLEGGMNDAVLLPLVLIGMTLLQHGHSPDSLEWARLGMNILVLSPAAGTIVGLAAVSMLELIRRRVGVRRDYESIYSLGVAFAAFAAAEAVHGSGFLAAFAAGLTISAVDVELCDCFLEYGETTAEMALMFTFVLFGASVIWKGLGILSWTTLLFAVSAFAARPIAFLPALIPAPLTWSKRWLIAWFGPRGLSSLLLVLLPVFAGLPGSENLLTICCLVVLMSVVLHGASPALLPKKTQVTDSLPSLVPTAAAATTTQTSAGAFKVITESPVDSPATTTADRPSSQGEFITLPEVKALGDSGAPYKVIDARTERTYDDSDERIPGAIRLVPDQAIRMALQLQIPKNDVLAILCA